MKAVHKAADTTSGETVQVPAHEYDMLTHSMQLARITSVARAAVQDTRGKVRRAFMEIIDIAEGRK